MKEKFVVRECITKLKTLKGILNRTQSNIRKDISNDEDMVSFMQDVLFNLKINNGKLKVVRAANIYHSRRERETSSQNQNSVISISSMIAGGVSITKKNKSKNSGCLTERRKINKRISDADKKPESCRRGNSEKSRIRGSEFMKKSKKLNKKKKKDPKEILNRFLRQSNRENSKKRKSMQKSDLVLTKHAFFSGNLARRSYIPKKARKSEIIDDMDSEKKIEYQSFNKENIRRQKDHFKGKIFSSFRDQKKNTKLKKKEFFHERMQNKKKKPRLSHINKLRKKKSILEEKTKNRISKYLKMHSQLNHSKRQRLSYFEKDETPKVKEITDKKGLVSDILEIINLSSIMNNSSKQTTIYRSKITDVAGNKLGGEDKENRVNRFVLESVDGELKNSANRAEVFKAMSRKLEMIEKSFEEETR